MTAKLQLLCITLAAVLSMSFASLRILDQHTDQSTAARDLLLGQMWQSFRPAWKGKVVQFDVYMGSTSPCTPLQGTLVVREGVPASFRDFDNATYTLLQQDIQTTCDGADCVNGDCITWQNFTLTSPVDVDDSMVFTFALLNLTADTSAASMARIGVAPSSLNHGGTASLVTSPKFETRYSQYTFRSWMDRPSGPNTVLSQRPSGSDIDAQDNSGSGSSSISSTTIAGIVVPIIVIAVFVVLVVVVVKVRRNLKHNMQLGSLIEDTDHVNSPKSAWTIWSGMSVGEQQQHVTNVNVSSSSAPVVGDEDQFVEFVRTPKTVDEEAAASARMAALNLSGSGSRNRSRVNPTNASNPTTARRKVVNVRTESNGLDDSTTWASRSGSLSLLPEHDTMSMSSLVSSGSNNSRSRSLNFRDGDNLSLQPDVSSLHDPSSMYNDETDI